MTILILGLLLFLGIHSVRIFADDFRTRTIASIGLNKWKGLFTVVSLAGFAAIVIGYGMARQAPVFIWSPPPFTRHAAALLVLLAFILLAAANIPGNHFKRWFGHPMLAGTKLWATAHLITNGRLSDIVLFGAFLAWSIVDFRSARRRDRREGVQYPAGRWDRTVMTVIAAVIVYAVFALYLHRILIGVSPL